MKPQYKNIDIKSAGFAASDAAAWSDDHTLGTIKLGYCHANP